MKTRSGFVSNSSTTSFCIVGVCDSDIIKELLAIEFKKQPSKPKKKRVRACSHKLASADAKFCSTCGAPAYVEKVKKQEPNIEYYQGCLLNSTKLEYYGDSINDIHVAGLSCSNILENMSLKDARVYFKEYVKKEFGVDISVFEIDIQYGEAGN